MHFAPGDQIAPRSDVVAGIISPEEPPLNGRRLVVFPGIDTSLRAARAATAWTWLVPAGSPATAVDAHHLALPDDQAVVSSYLRRKRYPSAALDKARTVGAAAIAVVRADAPAKQREHPWFGSHEQPDRYLLRAVQ